MIVSKLVRAFVGTRGNMIVGLLIWYCRAG